VVNWCRSPVIGVQHGGPEALRHAGLSAAADTCYWPAYTTVAGDCRRRLSTFICNTLRRNVTHAAGQ